MLDKPELTRLADDMAAGIRSLYAPTLVQTFPKAAVIL